MRRTFINPRLVALLLLAGGWALIPRAEAATTCSATQPVLSFGAVTAGGATDAQANFSVTCSTFGLSLLARTRVTMCLNIGTGTAGSGHFTPRRLLSSAGDAMQFQLYQGPGRNLIWGSRSMPAIQTPVVAQFDYAVPVLGGSQTRQFTIHGRIPSQALAAGTYRSSFTGAHTLIEFRYNESVVGTPSFPANCFSGGTAGASSTFPFEVSATVANRCSIQAATELDFGAGPGLITANRDQTSTITLTCTGRTAWNMTLSNGQNPVGTQFRRMRRDATGDYVNYQLYRDPQRAQPWSGTNNVTGTGTGTAQTATVYGRVFGGQAVPAGQYRDTITVTVSY